MFHEFYVINLPLNPEVQDRFELIAKSNEKLDQSSPAKSVRLSLQPSVNKCIIILVNPSLSSITDELVKDGFVWIGLRAG